MDEAMAWAKRCPNPMPGRSEMEIRPFYEAADLAEFMTPEELAAPRDGRTREARRRLIPSAAGRLVSPAALAENAV